MAKRTSNRNAEALIASRTPFKGNNFEGFAGAPRSHGWLSGTQFSEQISGLKNIDYTVNDEEAESTSKTLPTQLKIIVASADEIEQHEKILGEIAKSSKMDPIWSPSSIAS